MKRTLLLSVVLAALCGFPGCEKSAIPKDKTVAEEEVVLAGEITILEGTWELRKTRGGMLGGNPNIPAGNGDILKFNRQKLERYFEGKLYDSKQFTIIESKVKINQTESTHLLKFGSNVESYFRLEGDNLILFVGQMAADGIEATYVKL